MTIANYTFQIIRSIDGFYQAMGRRSDMNVFTLFQRASTFDAAKAQIEQAAKDELIIADKARSFYSKDIDSAA